MKRTYILKGLDCPHCSAEIEKSVSKLDFVSAANVNLMKQTLTVEFDESARQSINSAVEKAVHKHEPDVEVTVRKKKKHTAEHHDHEHEHHHEHGEHCECGHHHDHDKHEHHHRHGEKCECGHHHDHDEHHHHHKHGDHCECGHHHDHDEHEHHHEHCEHKDADRIVTFTLDELDCPNCAAQIENDLEKSDGIVFAEINLISQQLDIGLSDGYKGDIFKHAKNTVKKYEPDVDVIEPSSGKENAEQSKPSLSKALKTEKATFIRFGIGAALYAVGLVLSHIGNVTVFAYLPILVVSYLILGYDVVWGAVRNIMRGRVFDEKFLMTVSTIGAFAIGEYPEAVAVMLLYQIGEFFQSLAVKRSRRSISELMDIRPDSANLLRGGKLEAVDPDEVEVGDIIVVKPGEKLPLDGVITEGETMLDTRALTGESVPKKARPGDSVLSGCINETGVIKIKVTKEFGESTASKILDLVENAAGRKAPTENFISVFARYYTPVVVALAVLLAVIPPLVLGGGWSEWIRRCFVFLVISCPCALVISIPLTFFGGIGAASREGVLVKGSNYLEALNYVDTIVFDKTGTLTKGTFSVTKTLPAEGVDSGELLKYAAAAEKMSNHPIARSVTAAFDGSIDTLSVSEYREISGHGVSAVIDGKTVLAGNARLLSENGVDLGEVNEGGTVVYVALDKKYLGALVISDEIKEQSKAAIEELKALGVGKTVMLTGDNETTAKAVSNELGLDEFHAGLLPAQKVEQVEKLFDSISGGKKLAFVGDGINDAPVLARADVGIAMGALGSDAAIEAADIVLMKDDPSSLADALRIAKYTKRIVTQNIVLVLAVKVIILALGALGLAGMWIAVFGDVGIMMIAVLNSMRILRRKSR